MGATTRSVVALVLGAALGLGIAWWTVSDDDSVANTNPAVQKLVGQNIGTLTYPTLAGVPTTIKALHDGRPVLLNFWATWCLPCVLELPSLQRLAATGRFQVITVSFDVRPEIVQQFLTKHGIADKTVLFDRGGQATASTLGVTGVPTTLVVGQDLTVYGVEVGGRTWDHADMQNKLYQILRQER